MIDKDSLGWYLAQIGRHHLLTKTEELELSRVIQDWIALRDWINSQPNQGFLYLRRSEKHLLRRGQRAFQRFILANLRLVVSMAKGRSGPGRRGSGIEVLDLIQEGTFGLMRAIEKFDPTRGYRFSTYAYWWISQSMQRAIANSSRTIRLPSSCLSAVSKVMDWEPHFRLSNGRSPTMAERAEVAGVTEATMVGYMRHYWGTLSLDQMCSEDSKGVTTLLEMIADEREPDFVDEHRTETIDYLIAQLPEAEGKMIRLVYGLDGGDGLSIAAASQVVGKERGTASSALHRGMRKLKEEMPVWGIAA